MSRKRKACTYKTYRSADEAYGMARRLWPTRQIKAYKCEHCTGYHLARVRGARLAALFQQLEEERRK